MPARVRSSQAKRYELVGANALVLRVVCGCPPTSKHLVEVITIIEGMLAAVFGPTRCGVADHGWIAWTREGLRTAFLRGRDLEGQLVASLPRLERIFAHEARIRWGIWTDQYILPLDYLGRPVIRRTTARAIFKFEPDNLLLSSETIYRSNCHRECFVCAPRRLLDGNEEYQYLMIGRKRPSALDHAEIEHGSPFVKRERQLLYIEDCWKRARRGMTLAIVAEAGSGKTRLIKEWLARHPEVRALTANFSLFGGDCQSFAYQLTGLPADQPDRGALVQAVVDRVRREKIGLLVLDDIHWAGAEGLAFVYNLIAAAHDETFIILASRPSGQEALHTLQPAVELALEPLPASGAEELAARLIKSKAVATAAAGRSKGNPLFIEQFAAWAAETGYPGDDTGPHNLYQLIVARIEHLSDTRIRGIQQRLRWGRSWQRQAVNDDLARLETEAGLWLDRLETGDYADRVEAARHLVRLERLDYEIFITSMLAGRPRPRSSRLREAIERLLLGSADEVLMDLKSRIAGASAADENVSLQAERAGEVLFRTFKWSEAREFYELAYATATPWRADLLSNRLDECRRRTRKAIEDDNEVYAMAGERDLNQAPSVDALDLPYAWAVLAHRFRSQTYFAHVAKAAEAINDARLAAWAKRKAAEFSAAERDARAHKKVIDEN